MNNAVVLKLAVVVFIFLCICLSSEDAEAKRAPWTPSKEWKMEHIMMPMRDGVRLSTDIRYPDGQGPWPVVLVRTPYRRSAHFSWETERLLQNGYVLVCQESRGRFESEGESLVFMSDGWGRHPDGYDCVEWIAKQPWCTGKIGTFGISGPGITQYLLAGAAPPHLTCAHIGIAFSSAFHNGSFHNGVFRPELTGGWLTQNGYDLDQHIDFFSKHQTYDKLWKSADLSTMANKVNIPILHWGGFYDAFTQGMLDAFVEVQHNGGPNAKGKQLLIMGPWPHGIAKDFCDIKLPQNALLPPHIDPLQWFDYHLKGIKNDVADADPVYYYTVGDPENPESPDNRWRNAKDWPIQVKPVKFYLESGGRLSVTPAIGDREPVTYTFDPDNPVPTKGGNVLMLPKGAYDNQELEKRSDVIAFTTRTLDKPIEMTGRVKVTLWASSDCKDTDFTAKLCDVFPDGRSFNVLDGIVRTRYRDGLDKEVLMKPGAPYELEIDLWSHSWVFKKGHKIRLDISSSNYPRFDVNPNTGEPWSAKPAKKLKAQNTVYFDNKHQSYVELPIVE